MATFAYHKRVVLLISSLIVASSQGINQDHESLSVCKSVLLEKCSTPFCRGNITIVNKCPANSTDGETKTKCENFTDANLLDNTFSFRPVTSELDNITYWNMYCASCNGENLETKRFTFWTLRVYHRDNSSQSNSFVSDMNSAVKKYMRVDNNTHQLVSNIGGLIRNIVPLRYLPSSLKKSSYEFCSSSGADERIDVPMENGSEISAVPDGFNCTGKKFCASDKFPIPQPKTCVYYDKNKFPCIENKFIVEKIDFVYNNNGSKIILNNGSVFDSGAISNIGEDVVFLCSSEARHPFEQVLHDWTEYLSYGSTFLLFLFLIARTNEDDTKKTLDKIFYSYCVALLAVYLCTIFNPLIASRIILKSYLLLYIHLCYVLWVLMISYEYWFMISKSLKNERILSKSRKYRYYAIIGWTMPALLLCVAYLFLTEEDKSAVCPWMPDHANLNFFEHLSELAHDVHNALSFLYMLIFLALIPLMCIQSCNYFRLSVIKRRNRHLQTAQRNLNYGLLFVNLAYLMGIHWITLIIAMFFMLVFDNFASAIANVGALLFALHGTFIFFVCGFKNIRKWYESVRKLCGKQSEPTSSRISQMETDDVEIK